MGLEDYSTELKASVEAFLTNLRRRGKAPRTITRWSVELDRFVAWVGERKLYEIDAAALELGFLSDWESAFRDRNGRAPSLNSTRAVVQAVKSFYGFMERFGLLVDANGGLIRNPALALDLPVIPVKPELDWLHGEDDQALLACPMNAREDIVVFFLRLTGLRLGEALSLTNRDVDLGVGSINVTTSKTVAGLRSIPISAELRPHIERWLAFTRREGLSYTDGPFLWRLSHHQRPANPHEYRDSGTSHCDRDSQQGLIENLDPRDLSTRRGDQQTRLEPEMGTHQPGKSTPKSTLVSPANRMNTGIAGYTDDRRARYDPRDACQARHLLHGLCW